MKPFCVAAWTIPTAHATFTKKGTKIRLHYQQNKYYFNSFGRIRQSIKLELFRSANLAISKLQRRKLEFVASWCIVNFVLTNSVVDTVLREI